MPPNDTPLKVLNHDISLAIGMDRIGFMAKKSAMEEKWRAIITNGEHSRTRLINSILFAKTTPINISILADNLAYFKQHYLEEYRNDKLRWPLVLACLSGSEKIADFLLERLGKEYTSEGFQFVLEYAASSLNVAWVRRIASAMAEKKLTIPNGIYSSTNSLAMRLEICKIFARADDTQNHPTLTF